MDWNPAYTWLVIALLLSLGELTSGAMVLLALGIAAALTAAVTALGLTLPGNCSAWASSRVFWCPWA